MSDEDISLDEKRVFEGRRGISRVFVATEMGLARVEVSDDQIGRFGLVHWEEARDVAVDSLEGTVAVATAEDVRLGDPDGDEFGPTGFGPAVAVTNADGLVAADPRGRIARHEGTEWTTVASVDAGILAMDGGLIATSVGVYRIESTEDQGVALADVRDVASDGPFAATGNGVYHFDEGIWRGEIDEDATIVAGSGEHAVALVDDEVYRRQSEDGEEWHPVDCPAEDVVDLAVGGATYAITAEGTLFVDPPTAKDGTEGWASRSLGLTDVTGIAALEPSVE